MAFKHNLLGAALGWKHNYQPGMQTRNGELVGWPTENWPTDAELTQWVTEYEALPEDDPHKNPKAARKTALRAFPKNDWDALIAFIEAEVL